MNDLSHELFGDSIFFLKYYNLFIYLLYYLTFLIMILSLWGPTKGLSIEKHLVDGIIDL